MSLIKVKVLDNHVDTRSGVSKSNKPYNLVIQSNIVVELNNEVRLVPITLQDGHVPFPAGDYTLDPVDLLFVGRFGFEINRYKQIELIPIIKAVELKTALFNK